MRQLALPLTQSHGVRDVPRERSDGRGMPRRTRIPLVERPDEPGENPPGQRRVLPRALPGSNDQPRHVREGEDADEDEDDGAESDLVVDGDDRYRKRDVDCKRGRIRVRLESVSETIAVEQAQESAATIPKFSDSSSTAASGSDRR